MYAHFVFPPQFFSSPENLQGFLILIIMASMRSGKEERVCSGIFLYAVKRFYGYCMQF